MRKATIYFALIYPFVPLVWTLVMRVVGGYECTLTCVIREAAAERPILIAAVTALFTSLIWHWFGNGT